ncbi:class I SAM-dependent methyltransferase [Nocardioides salsibiostraticola]
MAVISELWESRVVPRLVDVALKGKDVGELRDEVCLGLEGKLLELGFGGGLNIRSYPGEVTAVDAVEPSDLGWEMSQRRRDRTVLPIGRVGLDGQHLAAEDDAYDSVLCTFTLCTIPDARLALSEVVRVLRPGGSFHFLEHGLGPTAGVRRWQTRLEPVQKRVAGGCHLTRNIPALVAGSGLEVVEVRSQYLPGPGVAKPWSFGYLGRAINPA